MKVMEHLFQACPERSEGSRLSRLALLAASAVFFFATPLFAQERTGGEANLIIPDLNQATFYFTENIRKRLCISWISTTNYVPTGGFYK